MYQVDQFGPRRVTAFITKGRVNVCDVLPKRRVVGGSPQCPNNPPKPLNRTPIYVKLQGPEEFAPGRATPILACAARPFGGLALPGIH